MKLLKSPRLGYLSGALVCAGLLGFALYLQYFEYQNPCPLCIFQRIAYTALLVVFVAAAIHAPRRVGAYIYSGLLVTIALIGAVVATRQVWLQHLPKDRVPECGPGLDYMLNKFPLTQALEKIFRGSGECAEVGWRMFGLSIAEWSLIWLIALGVFAVLIAVAARSR